MTTDVTNTRCAIVGTAGSWKKTPWDDATLRIITLNDAYSLEGFRRVDEHYDLHAFDEMWFRPKDKRQFTIEELPKGKYIRPEGHLEWLQAQAARIPIWLQAEPPADWPAGAQRFPIEAITERYGSYWASGPSYILAHLYERGCREIWIYGIHLATEQEYREQRPQFEMLIGRLLGPHVQERQADGRRYYAGREMTIVLPEETPLLRHHWAYAYEPRPIAPPAFVEARRAEAKLLKQQQALAHALITWPRWKSKQAATRTLHRLQGELADCRVRARHALITAGRL